MTVRPLLSTIPALLLLASCDKVLNSGSSESKGGSIAEQVQVSAEAKPQVVAAFEAISAATNEHNRVYLEHHKGDGPVNDLAYSAGISRLDRAGRELGGIAKQVIDAVNATWVYKKSLFVPFDTMQRQAAGMSTWSKDQAVQTRGWVSIIDQHMDSYDQALAYVERGEEALLRQNFAKYRVSKEISDEYFRLRELHGKEIYELEKEMVREGRQSLQCYRDALTTADPTKANELLAQAKEHEQKTGEIENKMASAIQTQLGSTGLQ